MLTKHLFGSDWSPRRLLRRAPRVVAIFSFRYDAHLVPDLIENLRPIVDGYAAYDDRCAREAYSNERSRKALLRQAARDMGAKWLLCIDPDERLEMAAAERMKEMTRAIEPVIWTFRLRELYTPTAYRADGRWGKKKLGCLFPLLEGQVFGDAPLHSRRNPLNSEYKKCNSGLNLYHLKMIGAERRHARRALYATLDPTNAYQKAGYDYLVDETGLILEEVPASRLYRPLYREQGEIWQPDLAALRPITEMDRPETRANTAAPESGYDPKPAPAPVRRTSLVRRVARVALGAAVSASPETADRVALFILSRLAGQPVKNPATLAGLREIVAKRTPSGTQSRRRRTQDKKGGDPNSVGRSVASLFANSPEGWSAEDKIFLMRALRRVNLLTEWAFHVLLTRLFAERRLELVRSLVADDSLGFNRVRDFHRLRLRSFLGDKSVTIAEFAELRTRAKGSFLYSPSYNELLVRAIRLGAVDDVERELGAIGASEPVQLGEDVVFGACRILSTHGRHGTAADLLQRHLAPLDEEQRLRFLEPLLHLDEAGALPQSLHDYCDTFRPNIGAKTTERLSEVYLAIDETDRRQFDRLIVGPLRALHNAERNLMDVRFSAEQRRQLLEAIIGKLEAKESLSLIRLGDGESYFFSPPGGTDIDHDADNALRERHWWGVAPAPDVADAIRRAGRCAIEKCDIIGLPSVYRVLRVVPRRKIRFGEGHQQRGLMIVLAATGDGTIPLSGKIVTEERCHQSAFDPTALDALVAAAESVVVVSCWPEAQLRLGGKIKHIRVPPAQKVKDLAGAGGGAPIFESYRQTATEVREASGPGTLVLVGAGIVGKIFVDEAKQAGAVALDVGSLLDYAAGHHTRLLADTPALVDPARTARSDRDRRGAISSARTSPGRDRASRA